MKKSIVTDLHKKKCYDLRGDHTLHFCNNCHKVNQ